MSLKITIVIPVYNVSPYISACLDSVFAQTYQGPMECILVDDCGTDDSMNIVRRVVNGYNGPIQLKILHHEHNRGLSAARNTGMNAATGDYIYFLDSDDEITPDCIEKLAEPLNEELFDLVVGNIKTIGNDYADSFLKLKLDDGRCLHQDDIIRTYRSLWNMMAQGKLYNRQFLDRCNIRFKEGLIHEDELWSFQIACLANTLYPVLAPSYIYKIRPESITTANTKKRRLEMMKIVLLEMQKFVSERKIENNPYVHDYIQRFLMSIMASTLSNQIIFENIYKQYRLSGISWLTCLKVNGLNIRKQIRDIHYLFSTNVGMKIYYSLLNTKYQR